MGGCFFWRERQSLRVPCPTAIVCGIQEGIAVDGKTSGRPSGGCIQKAQPRFRAPKRQLAGWRRISRSSEHHGNLHPRLASIGRMGNLYRLCACGNRKLRKHPAKLRSNEGDLGDGSSWDVRVLPCLTTIGGTQEQRRCCIRIGNGYPCNGRSQKIRDGPLLG